MRKITIFFAVIVALSSVSAFASTNRPLERLGSGLDEMLGEKAEPAAGSSAAVTKEDVGKGVARFVGGLWKVATFWYPESDTTAAAVSSAPVSSAPASSTIK